jgi:hypothetical protein
MIGLLAARISAKPTPAVGSFGDRGRGNDDRYRYRRKLALEASFPDA